MRLLTCPAIANVHTDGIGMFQLALNPFLWQGVVFALFGYVVAASLHALAFPFRLVASA